MAMKIPKPPKLSRDPKIRQTYQPEIKLLLKSQIVGWCSIFVGAVLLVLCILGVLNLNYLLLIPLLASLIYYENKQFNLHNDALILKRYLHDERFAAWYKKYHLSDEDGNEE